jgi:predicted regulator of Ras-like GTPase activity (Roadblock/LC7/MglB family)
MADIEVPHPGASEIVARLLSDALREHPDVKWLGLVSEDGFAIASDGEVSVDDDAVAAGAVRMMIQMRTMAKALGQAGTSQMFMEGDESGICVIDKDPWVLIVVGAAGVPIGLLRYEAREIAQAFPMGTRKAIPAPPDEEETVEAAADWSVVSAGAFGEEDLGSGEAGFVVAEPEEPTLLENVDETTDDTLVTDPDGEPAIRWADEPTSAVTPAGVALADSPEGQDLFGEAVADDVEELEMPSVGADDFSDWSTPAPSTETDSIFDLAPPAVDGPTGYEMPAAPEPEVDVAAFGVDEPQAAAFDLPAPDATAFADLTDDLTDLAPPSGPAIDLPPPSGPAFELPPPE